MVGEVIKGIAIKLNKLFGDEYEIYTESVEQGLKEPCFFIMLLSAESNPLLGQRLRRYYPFDIHFFTKKGERSELIEVAELMLQEMQEIEFLDGSILNGTDRHYEIVDGVLHFFVNYNMITDTKETIEVQGEISMKQELKG